jgi:adenosylcobinamide-GDP ribazoletransferase
VTSASSEPSGSGIGAAVGFLTVVGGPGAPTPAAMTWFPVVGAAVGGLVGLAWWGAAELWSPLVAAAIAVAADAVVTGALHHDGLADAADGLLPHMDRERRLAVMRQPDVGAFGVMAIVTVALLQTAGLTSIDPAPMLIVGLWCASRTTMAVAARAVRYARAEGLASPFLGGSPVPVGLLGAVLATSCAAWAVGWPGAVAVVATFVAGGAVVALAQRRIGGFTGDVLGAAGVVGQTIGVLVAAARW